MSDWSDDPEWRAYADRAERELRPMIEDSAISLTLFSPKPDAKLAIELGFTLLLGKPFIILKPSGQNVPATLARVADAVIEYDEGQLGSPQIMERVRTEVERIVGPV